MEKRKSAKQFPLAEPNWSSPAFLADPYAHYRRLRESDPVHWDESRGSWLIFRYADVDAVLRDDRRFSARQGYAISMLVTDPPEHTRLRSLVNKAFTARAVRELAPRIQEIVDGLLDAVSGRGEMDAIAGFAYPLPITVIAELLGVDPERRDFFRRASVPIAVALGPVRNPQLAMNAFAGRNELLLYFDELIRRRRANPRDDLVSAMIQAEDRGDFLTHAELLGMMLLLLVGGHETTVNLIGNGLLALLRNPDQLARFRDTPGNERTAIDELLRYDSPVQYSGRVAKEDVDLGGVTVRAGESVRMIFGSANHDPEFFADPDSLDVTRNPNEHLAFGYGTHFCLGAQLARLEGEIALTTLVRRFPELRLTGADVRWRPAPVLRGLEALPVQF
jgi:cytochrome P450